jgi:hypothetical protein
VEAFVRLNDKTIEPYLHECVAGKHGGTIRPKALGALAKLSGDEMKYLRQKLSDADVNVRRQAVEMVLVLKDKQSLPEIHKMLEKDEVSFAQGVAFALTTFSDADSAPAVRKFLQRCPRGRRRYDLRERLLQLEKRKR